MSYPVNLPRQESDSLAPSVDFPWLTQLAAQLSAQAEYLTPDHLSYSNSGHQMAARLIRQRLLQKLPWLSPEETRSLLVEILTAVLTSEFGNSILRESEPDTP